MEGTSFGRYRLVDLLGRGGMGEVWRAYDTVTDRVVAIKVLPASLSNDEDFQQRFRREAHAAARLDTPHVVPIYDYGEIDDQLFVSMRLIRGRDLASVLADGPLESTRAVNIIEQVAEALYAAHAIGLIHRDVKPSNILLDDRDFAYLIDFGIARAADDTRMTKTGNTIGTFAYIAPERLDGRAEEDARSDVYSLACVLYEALTGDRPFAGDTTPRLIAAHLNFPPPRPSLTRQQVPVWFDAVVAKGMAKEPDERYATTIELAQAAHDAMARPIARPARATTKRAQVGGAAQPNTAKAGSLSPAKSGRSEPATPKQAPNGALPTPAKSAAPAAAAPAEPDGIGRRIPVAALVVGAVALVVVIAAAIGISLVGDRPSQSAAPSPSPTTSLARSDAAQVVLPFTGLANPWNLAVDNTGTIYVTDHDNHRVLRLAAGSSAQEVLPLNGINDPSGVAVDSEGTVYVNDARTNRVVKLPGSSTQEALPFHGLHWPAGMAVDSIGTVYVADSVNNRVLKLAAGSSTQEVVPFTGLDRPVDVKVDSAANVFLADSGNNRVLKLPAGSSTQEVVPFTGLRSPSSVAVDSAGAIYAADSGNKRVLKLPAGSSTQEVVPFFGIEYPSSVAVDSRGNLYLLDGVGRRVLKLPVR